MWYWFWPEEQLEKEAVEELNEEDIETLFEESLEEDVIEDFEAIDDTTTAALL